MRPRPSREPHAVPLTTTLTLMCLFAAVLVFAGWRHSRPADPLKGPRLIPWMWIALIAVTALAALGAHLLNLFGIETGLDRPRPF